MRCRAMIAGLQSRLGPAMISTSAHNAGLKILMEHGVCKLYDEALEQAKFGNRRWVKAVLSPFVSNNFHPTDHRDATERR